MTEERALLFNRIVAERTRYLTVVVEDIYQPHNASAVLRSCDCFGVQDIHVIENDNKFELSEGVTMGSDKWLTVSRHRTKPNNTADCLTALKDAGYAIVATTPHEDDYVLKSLPLDRKCALVFGTEMRGISDVVREHADHYLRIPMYGFTESFNISVAAALTLYELTDRLRTERNDWQLSSVEQDRILLEWALKSIRESEKVLQRYFDETGDCY
jgi:tRNA (guanosine-2'-O-)-methyltransferase